MGAMTMPPTSKGGATGTSTGFLDWLAEGRAALRKGERTRNDLVVSCARLLADAPFEQLTVSTLCKAAGVAHGTFYIYFANLNAVSAEVLGQFVDHVQLEMRAATRRGGDPTRNATGAYMRLFEENAGLMKCLVTGMDAFPEARAAFQRLNHEWARTVVRAARRGGGDARSEAEMMRRAYALGGMVDQYLSALFVTGDPWVRALSEDREEVLDLFTDLWKRGMAP
ncbi:TetR/AcrR family transcriptional regulator [Roseibacterium sp. SDUM158017]|uniref:TetR/AcrR family transcriptional regulator n=1 Tax=Roseicyclus salinarum TaxID=3036773 RepID=UPI002414D9D7|nr:TetR/AcrR family transcriptional regulator [Roseibacterium sp. SDUM158017]MDG4647853.1 TetR/AcrR family transcriptional regulator [Roseibacterium sp. SDUM158017]